MSVHATQSTSFAGHGEAAPAIRMPAMANQRYRQQRQQRVRRHTRLVRRLRILLPATGLAMAAALVGFSMVRSAFPTLDFGIPSIQSEGLVMTNPRLAGHSEKGQAYVLEAERAIQPLDDPSVFTLDRVKAFAEMADGDEANMTAVAGVFRTQDEFLTLDQDIVIVTKSGYTIRTRSAAVDLAGGTVKADEGITIVSEEMDLRSDSAEVTQQGKVIVFRGNVKIIWQAREKDTKP